MNAATAEMLLYAMTAVAVVAWVEGLRFLTATVRKEKKGGQEFGKADDPAPANIIYGSAEVQGPAAELSQRAAAVMAAKSIKICEKSDESIVFETPGEFIPGSNVKMPPLGGQMRFTPLSNRRTRVDYARGKAQRSSFADPGICVSSPGICSDCGRLPGHLFFGCPESESLAPLANIADDTSGSLPLAAIPVCRTVSQIGLGRQGPVRHLHPQSAVYDGVT